MKYDFDEILNRRGTDCVKWDDLKSIFGRDDLISMWVADMDFRTPPCIIKAIQERLDNGVLGYTLAPSAWYKSIVRWQKNQHNWDIKPEQILHLPGIVRGLAFAIQCFTQPGDRVMVMPPVYHPFFLVTENNHRQVVYSPLILENDQVSIDFQRFEHDIDGCKVLILCNPHNPGGRVWTPRELLQIASICEKHRVMILSDEIHCDLTLPPYRHTVFADVSEWARRHTITFMAPSKTFNMPGISSSFCVILDAELREQFHTYLEASELEMGNIFSYTATAAAFSEGSDWLDQLKQYIIGNIDFTENYLKEKLPCITMIRPQASYLIYLNCNRLNMSQEELTDFFVNEAHLGLNDGTMFGKEGKGYMRLNVGCPKSILSQALDNLHEAVQKKYRNK